MCMENIVGQPQNVQVPNYSGVNIQIFNPTVATPGTTVPESNISTTNYSTNPVYPANYYTQNFAPQTPAAPIVVQPQSVLPANQAKEPEKKKTEKREVVQLTDDYIKNLESYLNNQNNEIRLMGAKEVFARLQEDDSRKNDPALNALVNKMLQDPYQPVRFIAMATLESKLATGNDTSVKLLKNIQQQKSAHGQDALKASDILLKMSGAATEKEFEIKEKPEKKV